MKTPTWSFATALVTVHINAPKGVLPVEFSHMVQRKTVEIDDALKALAKKEKL